MVTMTEDEWLASDQPARMLRFLRGRASDRQRRLFACACCRRIWALLPGVACRAIEVAERFADGQATTGELLRAYRDAHTTDFTFRGSRELIPKLFAGVPADERAAILGGTLGRLLGFDVPVAA